MFQFSSDYSHLYEEMTKKKLKTVSLVTTVPLFNLTEPSLNEPIKTLEVQQLRIRIKKMCHTPLISLQVSMKQYYGMP